MQTYIALLRGINVGGHKVKMEQLREIFESLGLSRVRSYINSGNIFFDSDSKEVHVLAKTIEAKLAQSLGYEVPTFLRSVERLESIIAQNPFKEIELTEDKRFCVLFTDERLPHDLPVPIRSSKNDMEIVACNDYEAFIVWQIIGGRPPSGTFARGVIPSRNTTRFYHTLGKILSAAKQP